MVRQQLHLGAAVATAFLLLRIDAHYGSPPCGSDEVQGEVQGASGYMCAPKCTQEGYNCPTDIPGLANAQPQCMLQDINRNALCGLLCQVDSQCPSGSQCKTIKQMEVGVCLYPMSFADWARQTNNAKLAIGWPSQGANAKAMGFQISKTQTSLQNLKSRYSIGENDADMVILVDLINSMKGSSDGGSGGSPSVAQLMASPSGNSGGSSPLNSNQVGLSHDVNQFANYANAGIPGFEREIHDTIWNIEHFEKKNSATHLFSGVMWITFLYLGVGCLFKYQQGARGIEMIPHLGFWAEYPKLVNDGVIYSKILLGISEVDAKISGGVPVGGFSGAPRAGAGAFEAL